MAKKSMFFPDRLLGSNKILTKFWKSARRRLQRIKIDVSLEKTDGSLVKTDG